MATLINNSQELEEILATIETSGNADFFRKYVPLTAQAFCTADSSGYYDPTDLSVTVGGRSYSYNDDIASSSVFGPSIIIVTIQNKNPHLTLSAKGTITLFYRTTSGGVSTARRNFTVTIAPNSSSTAKMFTPADLDYQTGLTYPITAIKWST